MRIVVLVVFAAVAAVAQASPRPHVHHRHAHEVAKRASQPGVVYVPAATKTKIVYMLEGHVISEEDVRQGIANGTLEWGDDGVLSSAVATPVALPTATSDALPEFQLPKETSNTTPPTTTLAAGPQDQSPSKTPDTPTQNNGAPQPVDSNPPNKWSDLVDNNGHCDSCDKEFPNGQIECSQFPYGYGALPIKHEGLGGWSGIQDPQYRGADGFDDITTVVKGSCSDGSCCTPGSFCSYGCPNPYLKNSFPKKQGRTGQSVGGLYCNDNGFLELADGSIGKTLCSPGSNEMTVKVQNNLKKSVSFCRTDYPGTESMTFPLTLAPGEVGFLANPDQQKYFFWEGKATSAHYYINKQGVPESEACTWGQEGQGKGNWSPAIIGTSFDDRIMQEGFSSLKQNELCKDEKLNYDITFSGDAVSSPCSYKQSTNQYCQSNECWDDKNRGCTAGTKLGGTLLITLSDD